MFKVDVLYCMSKIHISARRVLLLGSPCLLSVVIFIKRILKVLINMLVLNIEISFNHSILSSILT